MNKQENLAKQRKTPKSEVNAIWANFSQKRARSVLANYDFSRSKWSLGREFLSQFTLNQIRHSMDVENSKTKRKNAKKE